MREQPCTCTHELCRRCRDRYLRSGCDLCEVSEPNAWPRHPLREVLQAITGKEPPQFVEGYDTHDFEECHADELQAWCVMNARPVWSTGIGIVEAAEHMVAEAAANANIPDPDRLRKLGLL
jgi:hypothetical protein